MPLFTVILDTTERLFKWFGLIGLLEKATRRFCSGGFLYDSNETCRRAKGIF